MVACRSPAAWPRAAGAPARARDPARPRLRDECPRRRRRPRRRARKPRRPDSGAGVDAPAGDVGACQTGADANASEDCRIVGYVNSIQTYWNGDFDGRRTTRRRRRASSAARSTTGCGVARHGVGPFYCPARQAVYIDLGFFDELRTQFGAQGGPFAQAYVHRPRVRPPRAGPARHLGHGRQRPAGAESAVRCAPSSRPTASPASGRNHAVATGLPRPRSTQADIADGLDAAAAVGDDRIQEQRRAASTRSRGPTAPRRSASSGSPPATGPATRRLRHVLRLDLARQPRRPCPRRRNVTCSFQSAPTL